jgi:4-amino-4-deoxy-L-arabinose transferase-like glycosyltransferase
MKGKHMTCTLAVLALFFGIISPAWLTEGMFLDGVTYAAISKNLAGGLGSFWDLHYTSTLYPHFHEHPPLAFGLQALFFRVLGDGFLTERIYSVGTYLISGIIMIRIWKRVAGEEIASLSWLPLLFWITIPLVTWSAPNNLLENTLMVFTGLSVLFILRSLTSNRVLNLSLAGFMLFLGFLTKGFVALFPLSLPFWTWLLGPGGSWKRFLKETGILLASMAFLFLLLFLLVPESRTSLSVYRADPCPGACDGHPGVYQEIPGASCKEPLDPFIPGCRIIGRVAHHDQHETEGVLYPSSLPLFQHGDLPLCRAACKIPDGSGAVSDH